MGKIIKIKGANFAEVAIEKPLETTYRLGDYGYSDISYDASTYVIKKTIGTELGIIPIPSGYSKVDISGYTPISPRSCKFCSNIPSGVVGEVLVVISSIDISNTNHATIDIPTNSKSMVIYIKSDYPTHYNDKNALLKFHND